MAHLPGSSTLTSGLKLLLDLPHAVQYSLPPEVLLHESPPRLPYPPSPFAVLKQRHEGTTVRSSRDLDDLFPSAVVVHVPLLGGKRRSSWTAIAKEALLAAYVLLVGGASVYSLAAYKGWVGAPGWLQQILGVLS